MARTNKALAKKFITKTVQGKHGDWVIKYGTLKRGKGNPGKVAHLFRVVAEKLPVSSLEYVKRDLRAADHPLTGVYVAHDSMGTPRFVGRGNIFTLLRAHVKAHPLELHYFLLRRAGEEA